MGTASNFEPSPGLYLIKHSASGKTYVGSTANVRERMTNHRNELKRGVHGNRELQQAFQSNADLLVEVIPTRTKEEAVVKEQELLDRHGKSGRLFNVALDARVTFKSAEWTEEHRQNHRDALAKRDPKWVDEHQQRMEKKYGRPILADGVEYPSIHSAARANGISNTRVHQKLNDPKKPDWKYLETE